jgi:hypothetical protein
MRFHRCAFAVIIVAAVFVVLGAWRLVSFDASLASTAALSLVAGVTIDHPAVHLITCTVHNRRLLDIASAYRIAQDAIPQRCHTSRVTSAKQLVEAATRIDTAERRSYRLEPHRVSVQWLGLGPAVRRIADALWPADRRTPYPQLQAVLVYGPGDHFDAHVDRCETNGQEGVLIVDLGLRDDENAYAPDRAELFVENLDGSFAGNWTASGPGAWVGMPMRRRHGVYTQHSRRVVAVYTLIGVRPRSDYEGSCFERYTPNEMEVRT